MLSRVTGFVRIAAIAYALGAVDPRRHLQLRERGTQHRLRAAARRRAHRDPRPALREVPRVATTTTRRARSSPSRSLALAAITVIGVVAAPWIVELYTLNVHGCERRRATGARDRPPAPVHAADALLRHRHPRHRDAQRAPPLPRGRVRAGAQQRRRHRGVPRPPAHRRRFAHRAQRARRRRARPAHRPRHDRGRGGDGAGAAASAARACTPTCGSSPRGDTPPCSPCCGCRDGRSAT